MFYFDRKIREALHGRTALEKWLIVGLGITILGCTVFTVTCFRNGIFNDDVCANDGCLLASESIMQSMDATVNPCDDFYQFSCGNWKNHHFSEFGEMNSWFTERTRHIATKSKDILEELDRKDTLKSMKQARRLYRQCLDAETLDQVGYEPVYRVLENLGLPRKFPDASTAQYLNGTGFNVAKTLARMQRYVAADVLMQASLEPDPSVSRIAIHVSPPINDNSPLPELGLIDFIRRSKWPTSRADFGEQESEENDDFQTLKIQFVAAILKELTADYGNFTSIELYTIGQKLLNEIDFQKQGVNEKKVKQEVPKEYTFRTLQDYMTSNVSSDIAPEHLFDWQTYIDVLMEGMEGSNVTLTMDDAVYVRSPEYFLHLQTDIMTKPLVDIQQAMWWRVVQIIYPHTTTAAKDLVRSYVGTFVPSIKKKTREDTCTDVVKTFFGTPIAYEFYVCDDMSVTTKKVMKILGQLQSAFKGVIGESNWTDYATRKVTAEKVDAITSDIGYPSIFETPELIEIQYSFMEIRDNEYIQSMLDIRAMQVFQVLHLLGQPLEASVGTATSMMDPLEINAFYVRFSNSINIPAGILQMPFYYRDNDIINYGAIGSILGHEMSHGFDYEGKNFDVNGKKTMWWTQRVIDEYEKRAQCYVRQYGKFKLDERHYINGTLTLDENVADNIGLQQSWLAYKMSQSENNAPIPGFKKFTNDQLFFLAYANVWCYTPPDATMQTLYPDVLDLHSPNDVRVIGTLRNNPEFAKAWNCPVNSPMNPSKKCVLW